MLTRIRLPDKIPYFVTGFLLSNILHIVVVPNDNCITCAYVTNEGRQVGFETLDGGSITKRGLR